jgi:NAD(P)-dependent dehydrogenase (short-subunit alcohol dehydrogenase family)
MAEAIYDAGGKGRFSLLLHECITNAHVRSVYCLDRLPEPDPAFVKAQQRNEKGHAPPGSLHYRQIDVTDTAAVDALVSSIADEHGGLNGAILAAGVQKLCPAVEYSAEDARNMLDINFTGVMMVATACGRAMLKHKTRGASVVLIGSMSGLIANRGCHSVGKTIWRLERLLPVG